MPDTSPTVPDIEALVTIPHLRQLAVEITTDCNLACVYCHFAPLERRGKQAAPEQLDRIVDFIGHMPLAMINLSGDAEITLYDGWVEFSRDLLAKGANLRIISNFSKGVFSDAEVDVLSRYKEILVSLDMADFELMKKTRYRADLRTMTLNIQLIRARAIETARHMPRFVCNVVVNDKSVLQLDRTVAFAVANGFHSMQLPMYVPVEEVPGGKNDFMDNPKAVPVDSIDTLDRDRAVQAWEALRKAAALAKRHNFPFPANKIVPILQPIVQGSKAPDRAEERDKGETRMCLMPWDFFYVLWNGDVPPCCIVKDRFVGNLNDQSLAEMINGETMRNWRRGLLTGDLPKDCRDCTYVPPTDLETLRNAVHRYVTAPEVEW